MTRPSWPPLHWSCRRIATTLGLVAGLLVLLTLADPGITVDEPLDVRPGRTYVSTLRATGLGFFRREVVDRVFADNKEHPPLGRWLLGIASTLVEPAEILLLGGPDPVGIYVVAGRVAPAIVFGLLVAFIAGEAGRRFGPSAAWSSGFALIVMPRVFAHAHLGALDLFIAAAWSVALIGADRAIVSDRPVRGMALAGLLWGLALLVKIHAWLLPPIILIRALTRLGWGRGVAAVAVWTAVGLAIFFLGWPWLWFDTLARLRAYLGTGVERTSIYVQYFGHIYRDRDVPWHFPWFYFAATVPVGLHLFGIVGLWRAIRERDGRTLFLVAAIVSILAVFSTNVPVYDGERLYLLVFPLWAIPIGRGFAWLWDRSAGRVRRGGLVALLAAQAIGLILIHPFGLSYYSLLVGGLPGAERLGLELEYWSEAVDSRLLDRLAREAEPGATACLAPTLAPSQGVIVTSRNLARRRIILGDESNADQADFVVIYRRSAYWKPAIPRALEYGEVIASRSRQGVWLSRIVRRAK
jgi:4-amino-4-deoxy-L-arabinose transferase-like glycosyltransferase